MSKNSFEAMGLVPLDLDSQIVINGGKAQPGPSAQTGFWYDVTYYTVKVLEYACDGLSAVKG